MSSEEAAEHRRALDGLSDAARHLVEQVRLTQAPNEALEEARTLLERAAAILEPHAWEGPHGQTGFAEDLAPLADPSDPMAYFPYSPVVGRHNPLAPPVELWVEEGEVHGRACFRAPYCGPPNHVHGGVVAKVFDELLGTVNIVNGVGAMTGTLTIRYRKPTPLFEEIRLVARCAGQEGRKVFAEGEMWHGDTLLAEAEGVFILVTEVFEKLGVGQPSD